MGLLSCKIRRHQSGGARPTRGSVYARAGAHSRRSLFSLLSLPQIHAGIVRDSIHSFLSLLHSFVSLTDNLFTKSQGQVMLCLTQGERWYTIYGSESAKRAVGNHSAAPLPHKSVFGCVARVCLYRHVYRRVHLPSTPTSPPENNYGDLPSHNLYPRRSLYNQLPTLHQSCECRTSAFFNQIRQLSCP